MDSSTGQRTAFIGRESDPLTGKVPEVTVLFWVVKIAATTLGETAGDALTMSLNLGYLIGTMILAGLFAALVLMQVRASRYHAALFWLVIVATTTLGTTLADFMDRSLGIGYAGGSLALLAMLLATLGLWYRTTGSISLASIASRRAETFYWTTILASQTLGTALGDWMADEDAGLGLGYERAALVFAAALALVAAAYAWTRISHVALFWAAFVLTRPLGATVGDLLDKPHASGGLELSRFGASALLAAFIALCILVAPGKPETPHPPQPPTPS